MQPEKTVEGAKCPFDHNSLSPQKTAKITDTNTTPIEKDAQGVWQVRGYQEARTLLRSGSVKQAGFQSEKVAQAISLTNPPVLFMEGKAHLQQRKQTAKFFTPKTVSANYRKLMEDLTDQIVAEVKSKKQVDLAKLSLKLAVRVAGQVVGLTNSLVPGMAARTEAFLNQPNMNKHSALINKFLAIWNQRRLLSFFLLDVKPAIKARRLKPQEDVISHLLASKYSDMEILIECITYGTAGMATTREFISVAFWHLLEQPTLREQYLAATEEERYDMLHEILRVEPVVSHLYRRVVEDIELSSEGQTIRIKSGELVDLHIYNTNTDERVVVDYSRSVWPGRELSGERVAPEMLSFGDGNHRCPGAYIAIQETDILLKKLLVLPGLHFVQKPTVKWNDMITSYEVRDLHIAVD